jgi:hypothetical protein
MLSLDKLDRRFTSIPYRKYDTLNTSRRSATMVLPCTCGLFLYVLRNTNKHFYHRCWRTVAVFFSNLVHPRIYIFSFLYKKHKNIFTIKSTPIQNPSSSKREFPEPPWKPTFLSGCELHPSLIAMVRAQPFSGRVNENPCHHLHEFEEMCSCLSISDMT